MYLRFRLGFQVCDPLEEGLRGRVGGSPGLFRFLFVEKCFQIYLISFFLLPGPCRPGDRYPSTVGRWVDVRPTPTPCVFKRSMMCVRAC